MRAYVFVDGSNDEQVMALYDAGTGELRIVGFLTCHLVGPHAFMRNTVWHGVARRPSRQSRFAFFLPFSRNDGLSSLGWLY